MERTKPPQQQFGLPAIGIPSEVLFHPELTNTEKILYGLIRNLASSERGCYASNKWLSGLLGVNKQTISNGVANLKQWELIIVKLKYDDQLERTERRIFLNPEYPLIYSQMLTEKGYKKINKTILKNLYPSIKNLIGSYYIRNKEDSKIDSKKTILENLPNEWIKNRTFKKSLRSYLIHRKEKKQPLTQEACKQLAKKLSKHSIEIAITALDNSTSNGWTGVFPESINNNQRKDQGSNRAGNTMKYVDEDVNMDDPEWEEKANKMYKDRQKSN